MVSTTNWRSCCSSVAFPLEVGLVLRGGNSSHLRDAADDLDALAGELQQKAEELKTIEQASRKQRRARSLNGKDCQSWSLRLSKAAAP
jgi:hypothetical protein